MNRFISVLSSSITRVSYTYVEQEPSESILISPDFKKQEAIEKTYDLNDKGIDFYYHGEVVLKLENVDLEPKVIFETVVNGESNIKKKQTANGEVQEIENEEKKISGWSYHGTVKFRGINDTLLTGLGQYEDGIFNYKDRKEYLYQFNMKIAMPFLISDNHYAILMDSESNMIFESKNDLIQFDIDTTKQITFYVITGDSIDNIIGSLRDLTGRAVMLPRWCFGFIQSKERYQSSEELLDTVERFRSADIPIDCIVEDWKSWPEGLWGEKRFDSDRFPNPLETVNMLHENNVKLMISIWPNMNAGGNDYKEFKSANLLLPNSNIYDAYKREARDLYWKQCEHQIFSAGVDAWWCDNAEPFSDSDWSGDIKQPEYIRYQTVVEESKRSIDWEKINSYGLYHAKGIYENWRDSDGYKTEKRVVNLTRSSYISGQRYGVIIWSGDICARWEVMKKQIVEGLKVALCGMPFWTLDIGGFFVVNENWQSRGCDMNSVSDSLWFWKGEFENGVKDLGYRELYVRWMQLGTFLPIFRSHGTDTPREPWNFGKKGEPFYDAICDTIKLRYYLMPYIYSCSADIHFNHGTMMRSFLFDFPDDRQAVQITESYMFGSAFLVSPITHPMDYEPNSKKIEKEHRKQVYLPRGTKWYNFWTNECYEGGQIVDTDAPLNQIPLYVRAGSIIPVSKPIQYADENNGLVDRLLIYTGDDAIFTFYNDEGDNYSYELGNYSATTFSWNDKMRELKIVDRKGNMEYQKHYEIEVID